ncbi:MAG: LamB/YcsF family protein [Granulosicoccus sp.]
MRLNLNADLGESFGNWKMGDDERLLPIVNSANIACGFHAGDPLIMSQTIEHAKACKASIGAHPGFPDLQGFGRRPMTLPHQEVRAIIHYQLAALSGVASCYQWPMTHVKPHGALNNLACEDAALAQTIVQAICEFDKQLILLAPVLSELAKAAVSCKLPVALEVFADRTYTSNGSLVSRNLAGAVLHTADKCIDHVKAMIKAEGIVTLDGDVLQTPFHSVCVHGDRAEAVDIAGKLRDSLLADGHQLLSLPELFETSHNT